MEVETKSQGSIFIVSGGTGASGEQVVHTVLAQYPGIKIPVINIPHVRRFEQIDALIARVRTTGGIIVHTLVDSSMRERLVREAEEKQIVSIDLMGPLIDQITVMTGRNAVGHAGLYRQLHRDYFERVSAIEFSIAHDDGQNPQGLPQAEIVLLGISRVGKTPLSMYLAVLGWKVANIPIIAGQPLPDQLNEVVPGRVIGLTAEPDQVLGHRKKRQRNLGLIHSTPYTDPGTIFDEMEAARRLFRQRGFTQIDVSHKPIESTADEIIELINRRFKGE